ncbi:hypothetical protein JVT61DRAFT_15530 [Boletus reticuloceps]|uniref:Uncharacterized protein n=1 Tax=Boletus reticuloceps TaxID=495285 RepID=A0A8I3A2K8_9AGAM|nr:hypothetical protein JVT61DRAFT_15530 [Boletus reticuloceps]
MSQRHITTRATNRDRHPGIPDMPALRRSSEAVQNDLATQKATAMEAQAQQQQNIRCVAVIENELQERSVQRRAAFAKPTSKIASQPKRSSTVLNIAATPRGRRLERTEMILDVTATPHGEVEARDTAHMVGKDAEKLVELDGSETKKEGDSLFIVDSDMAEEGSDVDNHHVAASQAAPRKSAKKGKAVRGDIETARKQLASKNNANVTHHQVGLKRKGEDVDVRGLGRSQPVDMHHSKKAKLQVSGLKPQYGRLYKGSDKKSVMNAVNETDHAAAPDDQAVDLVSFGGLPDEEEKRWWAPSTTVSGTLHKPAKALPNTKLTKIVPDAPQSRLEHSNTIANATSSVKTRPSRQDLPPGTDQRFRKYFIPLVRQFAGTFENPWSTEGMIAPMQAMWDATMAGTPEWAHKFSEDDDPLYHLVSFCCLGHTVLTA